MTAKTATGRVAAGDDPSQPRAHAVTQRDAAERAVAAPERLVAWLDAGRTTAQTATAGIATGDDDPSQRRARAVTQRDAAERAVAAPGRRAA
jgi:hypothetical protein